jgi:siroheme synthase-like protein
MPHALYPIFLNLENRHVLIVGGGAVGARKAAGLLQARAVVSVVSPAFSPELESLSLTRIAENYDPRHMGLCSWSLVFAATNDATVNARVAADAAAHSSPCNRADAPDQSDFSNGAAAPLGTSGTLAVSTGSSSPVLAGKIRDAAAAAIDPLLITWSDLLAQWRAGALASVKNPAARRALLLRIAGAEMEKILRDSGAAGAEKAFRSWLASAENSGDSAHGS